MKEHKLTNKFFGDLLDEIAKNEPKFEMSAGNWVLIRKKIDRALKQK